MLPELEFWHLQYANHCVRVELTHCFSAKAMIDISRPASNRDGYVLGLGEGADKGKGYGGKGSEKGKERSEWPYEGDRLRKERPSPWGHGEPWRLQLLFKLVAEQVW